MRPGRGQAGFTLIELGIALGLLALVTAIAIPSFNAVTAAGMRSTTSMLAGLVREAYARAAITGKVHRIVLDMDAGAFWLERTNDSFVLPAEKAEADREGRGGLTLKEREEVAQQEMQQRVKSLASGGAGADPMAMMGMAGGSIEQLGALGGMMGGMLGGSSLTSGLSVDDDLEEVLKANLRRQARFSPVGDEVGRAQKLGDEVRFHRIWVEHQKEAFVGGSAELYFFPTGYTERAIISLTDDEHGERTLTLKVNPLTARTSITTEDVEVPR